MKESSKRGHSHVAPAHTAFAPSGRTAEDRRGGKQTGPPRSNFCGLRSRNEWFVQSRCAVAVFCLLAVSTGSLAVPRRRSKVPPDLQEILARMNETSKRLRTLAADLEYTKVTVVVNDKATETGELFYGNGKPPEVLIDFKKPDPKTILLKKNKAEIYLPNINEIQEYNLGEHRELVQQFLLLGFGTDTSDLQKSYDVKLTGEEDVGDDTTAVLELTPRNPKVAAQLAKVQLWISEESWLPVQQKFFEPGGDYLMTRYSGVKVNRGLPASKFEINAKGAKRVKPRGPSE
jgi:outer membrane lipoprotein-sorting protein